MSTTAADGGLSPRAANGAQHARDALSKTLEGLENQVAALVTELSSVLRPEAKERAIAKGPDGPERLIDVPPPMSEMTGTLAHLDDRMQSLFHQVDDIRNRLDL